MRKIVRYLTVSAIVTLMAVQGCVVMAQTPDVTIRKGKAVLDEEYYYQLKQRANEYNRMLEQNEQLQRQLDAARAELKKKEAKQLTTFIDSASYAIGRDVAESWQKQNLGINIEAVAQSLIDMSHGRNHWSRDVMQPLLSRFQSNFEERERKKREDMMAGLEKNKEAGAIFLEKNAQNSGVKTTKSGLQYLVIKSGNGKKPKANSTVKVHYTGTLIDGTKFDSSLDRGEPLTFSVRDVIPGWTEGLMLMDEGSKYMLYIPYNLAYGENPVGDIPPGSTLIFEVELIEIVQ